MKATLALSKVMKCSKSNLQPCDVENQAERVFFLHFCPPLIQNNRDVETMGQALLAWGSAT